tara:strand:- start:1475 stop:1621 length:147 start_codon:yes stop_codon:yes gene_type:complete
VRWWLDLLTLYDYLINNYLKTIEMLKMDSKPLAAGLLFGVDMALALKS